MPFTLGRQRLLLYDSDSKLQESIFSYGSGKQEREKHFVYYENPDSRKGRKRPPAIVFKESDGQIEVRVYVPK